MTRYINTRLKTDIILLMQNKNHINYKTQFNKKYETRLNTKNLKYES